MKLPKNRFLGKLCKRGHDYENTDKSLRVVGRGICHECNNGRKRQWRKENREKDFVQKKRWREKNPEYGIKYKREYRKKNGERTRAYGREYSHTHLEDFRRRKREMRAKNPERAREKSNEYGRTRREKLTDGYVRTCLVQYAGKDNLRGQIPQELIEAKRLHIKIQRFIRKGE